MADSGTPLFSAVASSPRHLFHLLRTISFAPRVQVRITTEGIRFAASERGVLDSFIFLSAPLFTSFRLNLPRQNTANNDNNGSTSSSPPQERVEFSLPLPPLLSTLQLLLTSSNPTSQSDAYNRGSYNSDPYSSSFAAHRINRHASSNAFGSSNLLGTVGQCRIVYRSIGSKLELSVPETGGIRTGCELVTYLTDDDTDGANGDGGVPFDRDNVRLKAIIPSSVLADAVGDVASSEPGTLRVEGRTTAPYLVLEGGATADGGECRVEIGDEHDDGAGHARRRSKLLETFHADGDGGIKARYAFATVKKAVVAMRTGTKVSIRVDGNGVLSLQFLVEIGDEGSRTGSASGDEVAFVDFRIVPLFEDGEGGQSGSGSEDDS